MQFAELHIRASVEAPVLIRSNLVGFRKPVGFQSGMPKQHTYINLVPPSLFMWLHVPNFQRGFSCQQGQLPNLAEKKIQVWDASPELSLRFSMLTKTSFTTPSCSYGLLLGCSSQRPGALRSGLSPRRHREGWAKGWQLSVA